MLLLISGSLFLSGIYYCLRVFWCAAARMSVLELEQRTNIKFLAVRSIAEQVNIDRETVRKILTEDLDMRKVCAKMIPKELTEEQTQRRVFSY